MQVQKQNYRFPIYESATLKKQRQSRLLSPKVTHVYPQIQTSQKIIIKRHHLDDTEMQFLIDKRKEVLYYDYQERSHPNQYFLKGKKPQYIKKNNHKFHKQSLALKNKPITATINSQYFDRQLIDNDYQRPERDNEVKLLNFRKNTDKGFLLSENQERLKKSTSTKDFSSLQKMENKVLHKLSKLQSQNDRISQYLFQNKVRIALNSTQIQRYKSENKRYSVDQSFSCFKNELVRTQQKKNQKLKNKIRKIKQQTKKLKEQKVQKSQSFRSNNNRVNKRVQCEIHDPRSEFIRKVQSKPPFLFDSQSDTDSQFSDF